MSMDTNTSVHVFFIISSVGFVILWILTGIFLFYLIRAMKSFSRIMDTVEKDVNRINEAAADVLLDIRESTIFNFIFGNRKKARKVSK